jgi:hypothetical protein|nr:MAG TPA: Protein of unknown function (DUF1040) [Caudoviricetes sp.]
MRDLERIDRICQKLNKVWKEIPDQRLGQLLENYIFGRDSQNLWFQEDTRTEELFDNILKVIDD